MNKNIFTLLIFIFILFLSFSTVCANEDNINDSSIDDSSGILNIQISDEDLSVGDGNSSFKDLSNTINSAVKEVQLTEDYVFDSETDGDYVSGILIKKNNLVINGNNHIIDAKNKSKIFTITGKNIIINNIILKNGNNAALNISSGSVTTNNVTFMNCGDIKLDYGAVDIYKSTYTSNNDKFIDNYAKYGSAIRARESVVSIGNGLFKSDKNVYWGLIYSVNSNLTVENAVFANTTSTYATAIYSMYSSTIIKKSKFYNLFANNTAGAIGIKISHPILIEDCEFINCSASKNGGAIFADMDIYECNVLVNHSLFENCSSSYGGAYLQLAGFGQILDSTFTNNYAYFDGGAFYISTSEAFEIKNSSFNENIAYNGYLDYTTYGGALFIDNTAINVTDSRFINNYAINAGAICLYDCNYILDNLEFNGNGNAIYSFFDDVTSKISNLSGTDNITSDNFNNTLYPSVVTVPGKQLTLINDTLNITDLPSRFNLADYGLVTPVKDQGTMASCWAFGILGALESALLKATNTTYIFSENNLQNLMLTYSKYGSVMSSETGSSVLGLSYLLSWFGAFSQADDSYDELGKISPLIMTNDDIHIQDAIFVSYTPGNKDSIDTVKRAITKYGALMGALYFSTTASDQKSAGYNDKTFAQYIPDDNSPDHAICVVGWDDNFSKDNFIVTPPGDGAWIIKNSWGTGWGDEGYFYVSYYDKTLCNSYDNHFSTSFIAFPIENTIVYNKNYEYDFIGIEDFEELPGHPVSYVNYYDAIDDDVIAAVGTYLLDKTNYTLNVLINNSIVYTQSGIAPYHGFHTIKLDKYVSIKAGDKFGVKIDTDYYFPFQGNTRIQYQKGVSLYNVYGYWTNKSDEGSIVNLKVYTLPEPFSVDNIVEYYSNTKPFRVYINASNVDVTISFDNTTMTNTTDENGTATFELPLFEHGAHPISVYFNNTVVIGTVNVLSTIDIPDEVTFACNSDLNYTILFYDKDGNKLNDVTIPVYNPIGTYNLTFTNYATGEVRSSTINVISRFDDNHDMSLYYSDSAFFYRVLVRDAYGNFVNDGESITFTINKKTYKDTTAGGVAVFHFLPELTPGTYTITATYKGQTIKNTIKIKQSLSSKKTVTVKKTAKKLVLQAKLKLSVTSVKGKVIKFKFKGKTYQAKTNSKGIAKVTIKKNVIKKLKAGKKYTVSVIYYKDVIKTYVKVKK